MALIRWEPAPQVASLQGEVNRLFNTFFDAPAEGGGVRRWVPPMDLVETDGHFVLKADLPGVVEDDVKIEVENRVLTISGERRAENEDRKEGCVRVERSFGVFRRSLTLPGGIDPTGIAASFENGVLEVRIPKPAERRPHAIKIGARRDAASAGEQAPPDIEAGAGSTDAPQVGASA